MEYESIINPETGKAAFLAKSFNADSTIREILESSDLATLKQFLANRNE